MRRTTTWLGLVAAASLLTACGESNGSDADPQPDANSSRTPTTSTAHGAADEQVPAFRSGTGRQRAENEGAWDLLLRDVRVGRHDGFDRVVVELAGTGTPGWVAEYVGTPRAEGSGEVVDVGGDHVLGVTVSGVTIRKGYPRTPPDFFRGDRHFTPELGGPVADVNLLGAHEGYSQLFLGIDGDRAPYRVFALSNPARLVVDVKHP